MSRSTFGSIRKKNTNLYELRYTVNGKRRSESVHGTKKQAESRLAEIRVALKQGRRLDMSIDDFVKHVWFEECETRVKDGSLSPTTFRSYKQQYNRAIKPTFGNTPLSELKGDDVQKWINTMTAGAAAHAKGVLRIIMRRAYDLDYVEHHPMDRRYIMPKTMTAQRRTNDIYTYDEIVALADEFKDTEIEAAYLLAAFGGGLLSEVCGIMCEECEYKLIQNKHYFIAPVNRTVHWIDREVVVKNSTKTEYRQANLIIEEPYSIRLNVILEISCSCHDTYLTDDGFGAPIDPTVVQRLYKKHFQQSQIPYIPFSNLRNAYSTHLHERGVDAATVSKLMRHSNLQTDYKHYNRPTDEMLVRQLGDNFRGQLGDNSNTPVLKSEVSPAYMVRPPRFELGTAGLEESMLNYFMNKYDLVPRESQ